MSEWIIVNIPYGRCYEIGNFSNELDSLTKRGLAKSGVQIRTQRGKKFLIGDINEVCGVCDDCVAFADSEIVEAYRVVFVDDA